MISALENICQRDIASTEPSKDTCHGSIKRRYHCPQQRKRLLARRSHDELNITSYLHCRYSRTFKGVDLTRIARNHPPFLQRLDFMKRLPVHDGCVNTICWNKTGEFILSGSDDCNLCVTRPGCMFDKTDDYTVMHKIRTRHLGNIFRAQFLPNSGDNQMVSCSSEGPIIVHDINAVDPSEGLFTYNCHSETIFEVVTVPDNDRLFLSCGDDKTIRLFDMRVHNSCARADTCPHPALIRNSHAITTLNLHPFNSNLMLVGRADGVGLVYDRRKFPDVTKFTRERIHEARSAGESYPSYQYKHPLEGVVKQFVVPHMEDRYGFTSLCYNHDGSEVLASYSGDYIYLFSHDASSNIELIRTLPKKVPTTQTSSSGIDSDTDGGENRNQSGREQGHSQAENGSSRGPPRSSWISRIRVRGDWSDTGVDSMPHSQRRQDGVNTRRPSLLERMAVSLSARQRFIPVTEIIAGPIEYNSNSTQRSQPDIAEEQDEDESLLDEDASENSTIIDEDDISIHMEAEVNESDIEDNEHYASFIAENLVGQATKMAQSRLARENDNESMTVEDNDEQSDPRVRPRTRDDDNGAKSSGNSNKPGISPKTKAKFKRAADNLKAKYDRIPTSNPLVMYQGHRNSRTSFKEAIFWGDDYVMSGSDCGRIIVWEKATAKIVMGFKADERVVNCLASNPTEYVLASSGIDYDIKLWSTQSLKESPLMVSDEEMQRIVSNNELMLEESKHTLSVPPHLFFRVLASLVQSSR